MSQAPTVEPPQAVDFDAHPDEDIDAPATRRLPTPDPELLRAGMGQVPPLLAAVSIVLILAMGLFGGHIQSGLGALAERADAAAQSAGAPTETAAAEPDPDREQWKVVADTIAADIGPRPPGAPALPSGTTLEVVASLTVSDEGSPGGAYDRDLFPHWTDPDGNGCDARDDVLARDFDGGTLDGCEVITGTGRLYGAWSGQPIADPGAIDIDHIVALGWAWPSGASEWGAPAAGQTGMRELFANDPANLISTDSSVNRGRGAGVPPNWEPSSDVGKCVFVDRFARVVAAYGLTVTTEEHTALTGLAEFCA